MATLIASMAASGIQPRAVHAGVNSVHAEYSLSATLSAGDIIQMFKLPDNARVLETRLTSNVNPFAMAGVFNVGTRADTDKFIASATLSANLVFRLNNSDGHGFLNDVSDAAVNRYTMIEVSVGVAGTGSTSGTIKLDMLYSVDQPSLS